VAAEQMPQHIQAMDTGDAAVPDARLKALVGEPSERTCPPPSKLQ